MKRFFVLSVLTLCAVAAQAVFSSPTAVKGAAVDDFALLDQDGVFHQLSRYSDRDVVAIVAHSSDCPVSGRAPAVFERIAEQFPELNIRFLMLNAVGGEGATAIQDPGVPVLMDETQLVARSLGLSRSGEVVLIDPARMRLLYRGVLGDTGEDSDHGVESASAPTAGGLAAALGALARGEPLAAIPPGPSHEGVSLNLPPRRESLSYTHDIVPILQERCVSCHQEGGTAPWAMDGHEMVRGWSAMMKEAIMTMRMPPGQIDESYLDDFVGVPHLTDQEKTDLVDWIESGARADEDVLAGRDALAEREPDGSGWALGEPDLVVEFPTQQVPAGGMTDYAFVPVEIGLRQDRWVRAYEFDIGNREAVHHLVVYTQDEKQQRQNSSRGGSRSNFGSYSPGREYVVFDEDAGVLLEREMRFMLQMNYRPTAEAVSDTSRIALYFHDSEPAHPLSRTAVMNGDFEIPAGSNHHEVVASSVISEESFLYSLAPHMHHRGKSVSYEAAYPDGTREELLSIPNFQYHWQMLYRFREPRRLPAGTEITARGVFDNSAQNPLNPDPGQVVRWGDQVWDEMFIGWMELGRID